MSHDEETDNYLIRCSNDDITDNFIENEIYAESISNNNTILSERECGISFIEENELLDKEQYTNLEWGAIINDYSFVYKSLEDGETIFHTVKGVVNRVCNGYYNRTRQDHPEKCKKNVCFKTALYYALRNFCRSYKTLYTILKTLIRLDDKYRPLCPCCHDEEEQTDENIICVRELIKRFYNFECICHQKHDHYRGYKENYLNYQKVSSGLKSSIISVKNYFKEIIEKKKSTRVDIFPIVIEPLHTCLHKEIMVHNLMNCDKKKKVKDENKIIMAINNFVAIEAWYQESVKLCDLLFNEQMYELYEYVLYRWDDEEEIINAYNTLTRNENSQIDINYINPKCGHTILSKTIIKEDFPNLIKLMVENGANTCIEYNLVLMSLYKQHYESAHYLIEISRIKDLADTIDYRGAYDLILEDEKLELDKKLELIEKLIKRGLDMEQTLYSGNGNHPLELVVKSKNSEKMLGGIFNFYRQCYKKNMYIPINILLTAIKLEKVDTLKILFAHKDDIDKDLILFDDSPLVTYLKCASPNNEKTEILKTILKYPLNIDVLDEHENTPIIFAIKKSLNRTAEILLEHGVNLFIRNAMDETPLIMAIKQSNYKIIKKIFDLNDKEDYIVNMCDKIGNSPLYYTLYSDDPCNTMTILLKSKHINLNWVSKKGKSFLMHVMHSKININAKMNIAKKYLSHINISDCYDDTQRPLIVETVILNEYELTKIIFEHMIKINHIKLVSNFKDNKNLEQLIRLKKKVNIKSKDKVNYYPLIYKYLVDNYDEYVEFKNINNNIFENKKVDDVGEVNDPIQTEDNKFEILSNSSENNLNNYTVQIIFCVIYFVELIILLQWSVQIKQKIRSNIYACDGINTLSDDLTSINNLSQEVEEMLKNIENDQKYEKN
jgi:ankyrin repeat protein